MQFYDFTKSSYCLKVVPCNVFSTNAFFRKVQKAETIFEIIFVYYVSLLLSWHVSESSLKGTIIIFDNGFRYLII